MTHYDLFDISLLLFYDAKYLLMLDLFSSSQQNSLKITLEKVINN